MTERDIFVAAFHIGDPEERQRYLDDACASDAAVRRRVEDLLALAEGAGSFLEQPAVSPPVPASGETASLNSNAATSAYDAPGAEAGTVIAGRYKLLEEIGEGGMGTVWMAEQTEPVQRRVAVKLIKPGMDSRQVVARFEAERQALALMDHPNIAKVLDGGATDDGRPFFVMELVKGTPITKFCDEKKLSVRERLELFADVCRAVQHAHQKGIIHRDLKPSNAMVAPYDGRAVVKVIDFGVAKATGQKLTEATLFTGFGAVVGTPEYMSPEQAELNNADIDTRSDIYSLGVLLYELLTGTTPLTRERVKEAALLEVLRVIREEEPPRPSTRLSSTDELPSIAAVRSVEPAKLSRLVRGELDWIVMKSLEKDRTRRYETANGLAADIDRYLADEPVQACPPSTGYRLKKFARRNKGGLAVAALVLFFMVLLGSGAGWAWRDRAAREAEAAQQQEERHAKASEQVGSIFAEVDRLEVEQKWPEALAAARRAEAVVVGGEADAPTAERVRVRLKDLEFIDRLERVRMRSATPVDGNFRGNAPQTDREYAQAFREYGADLESLPIEQSIDRLKARPALAVALAAELHHWADVRVGTTNDKYSNAFSRRLIAIARGIDPEPLRDWLRSNWGKAVSVDELRRVAEALDVRAHSPMTLTAFADWLNAKDRDAAIKLLRDAQRAHPGDFWLAFDLAYRLYVQKDFEGAARFYTAAVSIRPRATPALSNLGIVLREQKKLDEAVATYRRAIDIDPKLAGTYSNLGLALVDQEKLDEAIACYRKAIELDPKFAGAYSNLGLVLREQKRLDEAVAACRKAIEIDAKHAGAYTNLGIALHAQKKLVEAVSAYRKAIALDPKAAKAYNGLGAAFIDQGKLGEAVAACRKAIELDPTIATAHSNLGFAMVGQNKMDEAVAACRKAIELDPKSSGAYTNLGLALRAQKKLGEAVAAFRKAIELDPKNARPHHNLGIALVDQNKLDEAVAAYHKSVELDPTSAETHLGLGVALTHQKKLDEAVSAFRKSIELDPKSARAYSNLGYALHDQKKLGEAVAAYRKAIELDPKNVKAHSNLGNALREQKKLDEAVAAFRKAIEIDPRFAGVHYNLGVALTVQGRLDEAIACYRRCIEIDPKDAGAHNGLAWLLATGPDGVRNGKAAVEHATEACKQTGWKNPAYTDTLAAAHAETGDFDKAVEFQSKTLTNTDKAFLQVQGKEFQERLKLYEQKRPYRDPSLVARVVAPPPREVKW